MKDTEKVVFLDGDVEPQIRSLIQKSTKYVTFVTPYLGLWGHRKNEIDRAVDRGVDMKFIIRANTRDEKEEDDVNWLTDHGVRVLELENLHAKIYANGNTLLISSMNITANSTVNSLEVAIAVRDVDAAEELRAYVSSFLKIAEPITLVRRLGKRTSSAPMMTRSGEMYTLQ